MKVLVLIDKNLRNSKNWKNLFVFVTLTFRRFEVFDGVVRRVSHHRIDNNVGLLARSNENTWMLLGSIQ
jgi:hypothetical protein